MINHGDIYIYIYLGFDYLQNVSIYIYMYVFNVCIYINIYLFTVYYIYFI